jgi:hypothetical protein
VASQVSGAIGQLGAASNDGRSCSEEATSAQRRGDVDVAADSRTGLHYFMSLKEQSARSKLILSRCLTTLKGDRTLIAMIEMSQLSWVVAGIVQGVERHL